MLLVLEEMFYLIFPLSEDERQIKNTSAPQFLVNLHVQTSHEVTGLASFKASDVRAAVHLVKFHRHPHALELVGALFNAWLTAHVEPPVLIIPIPLSGKRKRERGFNQVELIARQAVRNLSGYTTATDVLARTKHTPPQTSLPKEERHKNVRDAFSAKKRNGALAGQHIILLDDVSTTGATLKAAKAALLPLDPASITLVAIAR